MPRESPFVRQWILLRTLSARRYGATLQELAEETAVTERTIRRNLASFRRAGFLLEEIVEPQGRKRWRISPAKGQPELTFAFDEAAALHLGRRFLDPLAGTLFWDAARRAFAKIRAMLGETAVTYLERFAGMFCPTSVGIHDYSRKSTILDTLLVAIEDCRVTTITYRSLQAAAAACYPVCPYGLAYHRGSLYLVGQKRGQDGLRHWKIDRMEAAERGEQRFARPGDFDLGKHLKECFGVFHEAETVRVCVRFAASAAPYVCEATWHPSQKLSLQADGSLLAEFQLAGTEEIKRWILGFGKSAIVLEPASLRQQICAELEQLLARYAGQEDDRPR